MVSASNQPVHEMAIEYHALPIYGKVSYTEDGMV